MGIECAFDSLRASRPVTEVLAWLTDRGFILVERDGAETKLVLDAAQFCIEALVYRGTRTYVAIRFALCQDESVDDVFILLALSLHQEFASEGSPSRRRYRNEIDEDRRTWDAIHGRERLKATSKQALVHFPAPSDLATLVQHLGVVSPQVTHGLERLLAQRSGLILVGAPTGCGVYRTSKALARCLRPAPFALPGKMRDVGAAQLVVARGAAGLSLGMQSTGTATGSWMRLADMGVDLAPLADRTVSSIAVRLVLTGRTTHVLCAEIIIRENGRLWSSGALWKDGHRHAAAGRLSTALAEDMCGSATHHMGADADAIAAAWE